MSYYHSDRDDIVSKLVTIVIVLLIVLGLGAIGMCVKCADTASEPVKQAAQIVERTINADNVIYNYEWFHQQYQNAQNYQRQIDQKEQRVTEMQRSLPQDRTQWTREDRAELFQLQTELSGLRAMRSTVVSDYNAHASMANRSIFLGGSLPPSLQ